PKTTPGTRYPHRSVLDTALPVLNSVARQIYVDSSLEMSAGKAAAQVGHGSMLLAAKMSFEEVKRWAARDFVLSVREIDSEGFLRACAAPGAVVVRDAGFTEVAPDSATVCALRAPLS
ncbi:aminoacyl-tRNA hydrolase, partial [Corynebacterium striatum]|uniref:aminoacyl-tRNA hydrolase n=1 Tax=Corynebacterium striatum TaxID=43770 RepID=UPI003D7A6AC1